jgi:hypothetical protein
MVKMEHVLILVFVLFFIFNNCSNIELFNVGSVSCNDDPLDHFTDEQWIEWIHKCYKELDDNGCPNIDSKAFTDDYLHANICYRYDKKKCRLDVGDVYNTCEIDTKNACHVPSDEAYDSGTPMGWKYLSLKKQKDICENVYAKGSNRNLNCKLKESSGFLSFLGDNICVNK